MKRLLIALVFIGAITNTTSLSAQSSTTPSRFTLSAGIGLLPTYFKAADRSGFIPLSFRAGIDVSKSVTIGGFFGFANTTAKPKLFQGEGSYITNKTKVFAIRATFKKPFSERVTGYGGSMLGVHHADVKEYNSNTNALVVRAEDEPTPFNPNQKDSKLVYSAFMGASVKVAQKVNLYAEIGYGISLANIGVSVRI